MTSIDLNKEYLVTFDAKAYKAKPSAIGQAGSVTNRLKTAESERLTIEQILDKATSGYAFKAGHFTFNPTPEEARDIKELAEEEAKTYEEATLKIMKAKRLESTDLVLIDIDDDLGLTDPIKLCNDAGALALYYSSSHNKPSDKVKGHTQKAYRLIYTTNYPLDTDKEIRAVQAYLRAKILNIEPKLETVEAEGKKVQGIDILGTNPVYGSTNKDYYINPNAKAVNVSLIRDRLGTERFIKFKYKEGKVRYDFRDDQYLQIAKYLGDTSTFLDYSQWQTMIIGIWASCLNGLYDEDTAISMIRVLDGLDPADESKDKFYYNFKPAEVDDNGASIGTLIHYALSKGYRFPSKVVEPKPPENSDKPKYTTRTIKKYIRTDQALAILNLDKYPSVLVYAPTGSGKTQAFIEACKEQLASDPNTVIYFACPTISLSDQIKARTNSLNKVLKEKAIPNQIVKNGITINDRFFMGTYDKTELFIQAVPERYKIIIIADEVHKEVSDYGYRKKAIDALFNLRNSDRVAKFIGLSGTPEQINLRDYSIPIHFRFKDEQNVAEQLYLVEYNKRNEYKTALTRLIIHTLEQDGKDAKVLAYLNNKEKGQEIAKVLRSRGIKVSMINADDRKSKTYRDLMDKQVIDADTQVILSTIALSDGISIQNQANYTCIICPSQFESPFFSIPLIKQSIHRFRNKYKKVIIPVYVSERIRGYPDYEKTYIKLFGEPPAPSEKPRTFLFQFEYTFLRNLKEAERSLAYLKQEYLNRPDLISLSVFEKLAGITLNDIDKALLKRPSPDLIDALINLNPRHIRYKTAEDQNDYYRFNPLAFINSLTHELPIDKTDLVPINEYLSYVDEDISKDFEELEELKKASNKEKLENGLTLLTDSIYNRLEESFVIEGSIREDLKLWKDVKDSLHKYHYSSLKDLIELQVSYPIAIKVIAGVDNSTKEHQFKNYYKSLIDLEQIQKQRHSNKYLPTYTIINRLKDCFKPDEYFTASERDQTLENLRKNTTGRRQKEAIKKIFNRMFIRIDKNRSGRNDMGRVVKISRYHLVNNELFKREFDLTEQEFKEVMMIHEWQKNLG